MSVVIPRSVTIPAIRETLRNQLRYHFPQIKDIRFTEGIITVQTADAEAIKSKIERMVDEILAKFARIPHISAKTYFNSATEPDVRTYIAGLPQDGVAIRTGVVQLIADLRAAPPARDWPDVIPVRRGLNVYSGATAIVGRALDDFLRRYFETAYAAQELHVPSMISAETVHRSGYFESGSQHLSFVAPLSNDPDVFARFLPYWRSRSTSDDATIFKYLKHPTELLNPALCLHCYPLLADTTVRSDDQRVLTVGGSCFRDEGGNLNNVERLNEFRMREIVFVGNAEPLDRFHSEMTAFTILFGSLLGFQFTLESATDIFFNENAQAQMFSQLLSTDKIELRVHSPQVGKHIAVASINKHGTHFGKGFKIRDENGRPAFTMCAAYGIDRLTLALDQGEGYAQNSLADAVAARAERYGLL